MKEVYYIGGSPCSGKSTIAEKIADKYKFAYYRLDDDLEKHMQRAANEDKTHSAVALALDFEQMWMRSPQLQMEEELAIYEEIFPYAMQTAAGMDSEGPVITEGAGFTPDLVLGTGVDKKHYICIVPTEEFQRETYAKRSWIGHFLAGCRSPEIAFDNWMRRDALFATEVLRQANRWGCESIVVDGKQTIGENFQKVVDTFGLDF